MRDLETTRFIRLSSAILGAMGAVDDKSRRLDGAALVRAYQRFRAEALEIVPTEHLEELKRICPEWTSVPDGETVAAETSDRRGRRYGEARVMLNTLAGFLRGYELETQMNLNAEAYAAAKLEDERPVGFQPA